MSDCTDCGVTILYIPEQPASKNPICKWCQIKKLEASVNRLRSERDQRAETESNYAALLELHEVCIIQSDEFAAQASKAEAERDAASERAVQRERDISDADAQCLKAEAERDTLRVAMDEMSDAFLKLDGPTQAAIPGPIFGILGQHAVNAALAPAKPGEKFPGAGDALLDEHLDAAGEPPAASEVDCEGEDLKSKIDPFDPNP